MSFYFDQEFDKTGTYSIKWEFLFDDDKRLHGDHAHPRHGAKRLLPMWVADMDFRPPPQVIEALTQRATRGHYGYAAAADSYYEVLMAWFETHYGRSIQQEWVVTTPGVVPTLNIVVQTFTQPGDKVIIQRPVYHPFTHAIENNGRVVSSNSLIFENGRYEIDFDDLETRAADPDATLFILCSPHNPVGRVWTAAELTRMGRICEEHGVMIVSDEIHCDLIYSGHTFTTLANLDSDFCQNSIVCTAASKTFNLAGLKTSNIIVPNPEQRELLQAGIMRNGLYGVGLFGLFGTEAAYQYGASWLTDVMAYIEENYRTMAAYLAAELPEVTVGQPEGTYLAWVNFGELGLTVDERNHLLRHDARLLVNDGSIFGPEGDAFARFNLACPRSILIEALDRLKTAVRAC